MKTILLAVTQLVVIVSIQCAPCTKEQSLDITNGLKHPNSSVIFEGVEYKDGTWYELKENGTTLVMGCPCIGRKCVHRCCKRGSAFYIGCTETNSSAINPFSPPVYNGKVETTVAAHELFFYLYQRPCDNSYLVDSGAPGEELYIQENGTLYEVAAEGQMWHPPTTYCVEMMFNENFSQPRLVAGVCFPDFTIDDSAIHNTAYAIDNGLILSVPFLLATFLIYAFIPEQRNLHGMCPTAYCGGLILAYPFLAYLTLHVGQVGVAMTGCLVVAFIVYYAFETSFLWLNVMCFDTWKTFSMFGMATTERDQRTGKWNTTSTVPTEDTRISTDDSALRLKDMH